MVHGNFLMPHLPWDRFACRERSNCNHRGYKELIKNL